MFKKYVHRHHLLATFIEENEKMWHCFKPYAMLFTVSPLLSPQGVSLKAVDLTWKSRYMIGSSDAMIQILFWVRWIKYLFTWHDHMCSSVARAWLYGLFVRPARLLAAWMECHAKRKGWCNSLTGAQQTDLSILHVLDSAVGYRHSFVFCCWSLPSLTVVPCVTDQPTNY